MKEIQTLDSDVQMGNLRINCCHLSNVVTASDVDDTTLLYTDFE